MELKYVRTFSRKEKLYFAGEIEMLSGYGMEIIDPRVQLREGKLAPGESAMLLFGITPEEYALKDSDLKKMDALAAKLRKEVPADRLLACRIVDLKGASVNPSAKPETTPSIDDGAYVARVKSLRKPMVKGPIDEALLFSRKCQTRCAEKDAAEADKSAFAEARHALGEAILTLEALYVAYDVSTKGKWPALSFDGRMEVFTLQERAENAHRQISAANAELALWEIRKIERKDLDAFFVRCAADGLNQLRVDNGFVAAELSLKDFRGNVETVHPNTELRALMIREIQCGLRWKRLKDAEGAREVSVRGALESMLTLRGLAWRTMGNAVLYAVCVAPLNGKEKLCTLSAREKLGEGYQVVPAEKCALVTDNNSKQSFIAAFTTPIQAAQFAAQMKNMPAHAVAMSFDDLAKRAAQTDGLLFDLAQIVYRLPKAEFDKVFDLRAKPPVIVRVKPTEKPEEGSGEQMDAPQPRAGAPVRVDSSLPDPDQFNLPRGAEEDAASESKEDAKIPEDSEDGKRSDAPKKGFFKKLFGGK